MSSSLTGASSQNRDAEFFPQSSLQAQLKNNLHLSVLKNAEHAVLKCRKTRSDQSYFTLFVPFVQLCEMLRLLTMIVHIWVALVCTRMLLSPGVKSSVGADLRETRPVEAGLIRCGWNKLMFLPPLRSAEKLLMTLPVVTPALIPGLR